MGRCSWNTRDILEHVEHADTFFSRFKGLLGRSALPVDTGLLITPCSSVHTLGMQFAIGVVFLDRSYTVCRVLPLLPPGRFSPWVPRAHHVLEVHPEVLRQYALAPGDTLTFHG